MHTIDLLEEALRLAEQAGFEVRRQWLGESNGGACRIGEQKVLFVNLSLTAEEQLRQVIADLRGSELKFDSSALPVALKRLLS